MRGVIGRKGSSWCLFGGFPCKTPGYWFFVVVADTIETGEGCADAVRVLIRPWAIWISSMVWPCSETTFAVRLITACFNILAISFISTAGVAKTANGTGVLVAKPGSLGEAMRYLSQPPALQGCEALLC